MLRQQWPWHLLTMLRQTWKTDAITRLVEACSTRSREGCVTNGHKGDVPSRYQSVAPSLAQYGVRPPIALRRIDRDDGPRGTDHERSHKSERVERDTVEVSTFSGRRVPQVLPQGCKRVRYDGVQATKTFEQIKPMMRDALAKVKGLVQGAITIIAPLTSRQRYQQSTGRDPLRCPHCQRAMGVWRIWHPPSGTLSDELEAMKRGK
jgi:hypothetical protein